MLYDSIQILAKPKEERDVVTMGYVGNIDDMKIAEVNDLVSAINYLNEEIKKLNDQLKSTDFIQVDDYIDYQDGVMNLSHQNIVEEEDFELTVNGIEYLIDVDYTVDYALGIVEWKDDSFELDNSMEILAQYKIRKRDE